MNAPETSHLRRHGISPPGLGPNPDRVQAVDFDIVGLFRTLWLGKGLIVAVTLVALTGALVLAETAVPLYTAETAILLERRDGRVMNFEGVLDGFGADKDLMKTEAEVMRSRELLRQLVVDMSLVEDPDFNASLQPRSRLAAARALFLGPGEKPDESSILSKTVDRVLQAVTVTNVAGGNIFKIHVSSVAPEKAAEMAGRLADLYIRDQRRVRFAATTDARHRLAEEVADLKSQLEESERRLREFTAAAAIISPEALSALNAQLKDTRDRKAEIGARLTAARERLSALQAAAAGGDPAAMAAAIAGHTGSAPPARPEGTDALAQRIAELVESEAAEIARGGSAAVSVEQSARDLEQRIAQQSAELGTVQELEREVEANRVIYSATLGRLKELAVQERVQQADARILYPAEVPTRPSEPKKSLILAVALVMGMIGGSGAVLVREGVRNGFRTAHDLERATGLGVLAEVPLVAGTRQLSLEHILSGRVSQFSEAVRSLRTSVLLDQRGSLPRIVAMTSAVPGEGKTIMGLAFAHSLSMVGYKVLLVDADLRRRSLTQHLRLAGAAPAGPQCAGPGLSAVIVGSSTLAEAVCRCENSTIDFLPGDSSDYNPVDLFGSAAFASLLETARKSYDWVVLDTAPALFLPDARLIAARADDVFLVVRWDSTTRWQVAETLQSFWSSHLEVDGVILNQIVPKRMKSYGHGDRRGAYAMDDSHYGDAGQKCLPTPVRPQLPGAGRT